MTLMIMYFVNFMVMVYPASRAISLLAAICSVSVTSQCMNIQVHNYMYCLQLTAVAFIALCKISRVTGWHLPQLSA